MAANTKFSGAAVLITPGTRQNCAHLCLCRSKQQQPTLNSVFLGLGMQYGLLRRSCANSVCPCMAHYPNPNCVPLT